MKMRSVLLLTPDDSSFKGPLIEAFKNIGFKVNFLGYRKGTIPIRILRFLPKIGGFDKASKAIEKNILKTAERLRPDIIFVNKGELLSEELLLKLKGIGVTVNLFPEYSNYWNLAKKLSEFYDIFLVIDYPLLNKLKKIGRRNVYYWALGVMPQEKENFEKIYDISFVGTYRPSRETRLSKLKDFNLNIWGDPRWRNSSLKKFVRGGRISQRKMKDVIKKSKINLNIYFDGFLTDGISLRVFEVIECGEFLLSEYKNSIAEIFKEDREIVFYRNTRELRKKIIYYLDKPKLREKVAMEAYKRARKYQTMEIRLKSLLKIVSLWRRSQNV